MRGELDHVHNPRRTHVMWALFYLLAAIVFIGVFLLVAGRIRTYYMPTGAVQLNIPYNTYLVGEPITFTLTNNYDSAIYINNKCPQEPLAVYRQEGGKWVRLHDNTSVANCKNTDRQVKVASSGTQSGSYANWPTLFSQPGKYRVVAYVEYFNIAPYQDFEVIARPPIPAPLPVRVPRTTIQKSTAPTPAPTNQENESNSSSATPSLSSKTISVQNFGSIYLQYSTTIIYVKSIVPAAGCTYEGGQSGPQVQVTFKCSGRETQVNISLSGGKIFYSTQNDG